MAPRRQAAAACVRVRRIHHQPGEIIYIGPRGARAGDLRVASRRPTLRPVMAASVPASLPSTRESPARVDSEQSGPPLPRGRAVAVATQRDQRSPPPSAQKRRNTACSDEPSGKRADIRSDDEHFRRSTLRLPSLPHPAKVRRRQTSHLGTKRQSAGCNRRRTLQCGS